MTGRLLHRLNAALARVLPEQRLFLRSDRETRFVRLRPLTQALMLGISALVIGWTLVATAILFVESMASGDAREQAMLEQSNYEQRLNGLADARDARAAEAASAQARFNTALEEGAKQTLKPTSVGPDDVAFLQYTGGTTGVSKGATLLHRNIVANVLQSEAWMNPALTKPGRDGRMLAADEEIVTITALPLYHIFALTVCCLLSMRKGGLAVLIPNPRDIPGFIKVLKQYRFHMFPAVNTLYNALLNNPEFKSVDCSNLRVANGGGMAVQEAVAKKWLEVTGCPIIEGYGLSETSPSAICNPTNTDKFSGTVGLPIPGTEIAIRDDEGRDLPIGQAGEICIRGPQVMAGYWKRPDETAKVMYADGYFKTGDVGVMDERGYTKIVDRKKDMILVSGFNVYPNEIEGVVAMCPGVLEVAAVGVPDVHSGEVVKLFVVRRDPTLTEETLQAFCKEQLTGYKRPKFIEFRNELPKTNVGKILRRELRDEAMKKRA